jgi:hypothetical protein
MGGAGKFSLEKRIDDSHLINISKKTEKDWRWTE